MSLSRHEGLRCQNVTFCPLCVRGEPQLSLHLLFWPFGSLKEELLLRSSQWTFCASLRSAESCGFFFSGFLKFCSTRPRKRRAPGGILNENKNQLGHGLVTIRGAAVWRSEILPEMIIGASEKARTNQICSGVFFEGPICGYTTISSCGCDQCLMSRSFKTSSLDLQLICLIMQTKFIHGYLKCISYIYKFYFKLQEPAVKLASFWIIQVHHWELFPIIA